MKNSLLPKWQIPAPFVIHLRMVKKHLFLFAVLYIMQGCVAPNSVTLKGEKTLINGQQERELSVLSLPSYEAIALETTDNSLIKHINRLYCYQDTLFVFDRAMKRINLFNRNGKYIRTLSHVGQGPGEYVQIQDFCLDAKNKRIILSCDVPHKLLYYSFSGDFLKEVSLPLYYTEIICNETHLYGLVEEEEGNRIEILDLDGNQIDQIEIPAISLKIDTPTHKHTFAAGHRMSVYKGVVFLTCPYDNAIYTLQNNELYKKYELDFKEQTLPQRLLNEQISSTDFSKQCRANNWVCTILDIAQTQNTLFFRTNSGFFLCNKKEGTMTNYRILSLLDIGGTSSVQKMYGTNEIVEIFHGQMFQKLLNNYVKYQGDEKKLTPKLLDIYHTIDKDSNPVLILCKI